MKAKKDKKDRRIGIIRRTLRFFLNVVTLSLWKRIFPESHILYGKEFRNRESDLIVKVTFKQGISYKELLRKLTIIASDVSPWMSPRELKKLAKIASKGYGIGDCSSIRPNAQRLVFLTSLASTYHSCRARNSFFHRNLTEGMSVDWKNIDCCGEGPVFSNAECGCFPIVPFKPVEDISLSSLPITLTSLAINNKKVSRPNSKHLSFFKSEGEYLKKRDKRLKDLSKKK